jgi:arsenate reductase (thioredoxin)
MAEALARKYGSDVLTVSSAGLTPAVNTHILTRSVLKEINVDLGEHRPRHFDEVDLRRFDLIVNMSGEALPERDGVPVETWEVKDPYGRDEEEFRRARGDIEMKVMHLILRARKGKLAPLVKNFGAAN